jgi:hypothetical protein
MAQRSVNHDSISYDGPGGLLIADWRSKIASGKEIEAAPIDQMINVINAWDNHTHTYTDYYQRATFGNSGDRTNYEETKTTGKHNEDSSNVGGVDAGDLITAAKHNEMKNVVNKLRSHYHTINDRTAK